MPTDKRELERCIEEHVIPPTVSLHHVSPRMHYWMKRCILLLLVQQTFWQAAVSAQLFVDKPVTLSLYEPLDCIRQIPSRTSSALQRRPYDVLLYDVILDWRLPLTDSSSAARTHSGYNRITLRCDTAHLETILLNAHRQSLAIDSVFLYPGKRPVAIQHRDPDVLELGLPQALRYGDTIALDIYYRNISQGPVWQDFFGGYNRYWKVNDTTPLPAPIAYTMSQPNSARRWMPCNDRPYDKALASIAILAPPGFLTLSNGKAVSEHIHFNGSSIETVRYQSEEPVSTYLMVAIASRYASATRLYRSIDSMRQIPLRLYLWHRDSTSYPENISWMLDVTAQAMSAYERLLVPYPFQSYSQALLWPYFTGAMEHQTMTTLHRDAMIKRWETVIVHELMHHWTGNLVTCATWNDLWLNEGGATYGERLWIESARSESEARRYFATRRNRDYLRNDGAWSQPPVYNTTGTNLFNTGTTYVKAGWIFHMMRSMLGDSSFLSLLRHYFNTYAFGALETEDFIAFCQEQIPSPIIPWRTFFDQWIYAVGHPVLHTEQIMMFPDGERYRLRLLIEQTQDSSKFLPTYQIPLHIRCWGNAGSMQYDTNIIMDQRRMMVDLFVPFRPDSTELDPDDRILCEKVTPRLITSVESTTPSTPIVRSYALTRGTPLQIILDGRTSAHIRVFSMNGGLISETRTIDPIAAFPTNNLAAGVYIIVIEQGSTVSAKLLSILP